MRRRALLGNIAGSAAVLALPGASRAQAVEVDLRLVLAIDVSRSIDEDEARLQREGYVQALTDRHVVRAMIDGPLNRMALAYVEWAGTQYQRTLLDWTLIDSPQAADEFAGRLAESPYTSQSWTAVGAALAYAAEKFDDPRFTSRRKVIDISGDGKTNNGPPAEIVRDELVKRGIVINGLPIVNDRPNLGRTSDDDLDIYYEENVIGGPGAFSIVARGFADFGRAIRQKMVRETAWQPAEPGMAPI